MDEDDNDGTERTAAARWYSPKSSIDLAYCSKSLIVERYSGSFAFSGTFGTVVGIGRDGMLGVEGRVMVVGGGGGGGGAKPINCSAAQDDAFRNPRWESVSTALRRWYRASDTFHCGLVDGCMVG